MRRFAMWTGLAAAVVLGSVQPAVAQLGVGAKVGTTGVGGEVALGLSPQLALRGSATVFPTDPSGTYSDVDYTLELPSPVFMVGADFYPLGGGFRIMGGVLIGAEETTLTGRYSGTVEIGNRQYQASDLGDLRGLFTTRNTAPFVGIGFGRHVGTGIGLTLDLGVAFLGDPTLRLSANGPCTENPTCNAELQTQLRQEEAEIQDDLDRYARYFPILNLGVKIGLF